MQEKNKIKIGIGFATGRKSFQKVLKNYVYNWQECGLTERKNVELNLFVAYDLQYKNTRSSDYTDLEEDVSKLIDNTYFMGHKAMEKESEYLIKENVITKKEAKLLFGGGYAAQRNTVLYAAIKNGIDYLLFLDDDEYPMAVTKTRWNAIWGGQDVLSTHLKSIEHADLTNGYHCGYISPIPYIEFNSTLGENDFKYFIEAISNDIINWDSIRSVMENGGVTYADTKILTSDTVEEVQEVNHTKFISGSNLCINLTDPMRVYPFYNPPGARGEDTFLSTCLRDRKLLRVPCYTFHDGFSTYNHLLDGVLPIKLKYIQARNSKEIVDRFYKTCIGWIRYKPLLLYIIQRNQYKEKIQEMRDKLKATLPKICDYFRKEDFNHLFGELEKYHNNVENHYQQYRNIQTTWKKICDFIIDQQSIKNVV